MLSTTATYALRTLGYLADNRDRWVLAREIAEARGIPANYLSKILSQLKKKGLLHSQKGWGGGFRLREEAGSTPIETVLELFDGRTDAGSCVFRFGACNANDPCPLHGHWERIRGEIDSMRRTVTLADLRTGGRRPA